MCNYANLFPCSLGSSYFFLLVKAGCIDLSSLSNLDVLTSTLQKVLIYVSVYTSFCCWCTGLCCCCPFSYYFSSFGFWLPVLCCDFLYYVSCFYIAYRRLSIALRSSPVALKPCSNIHCHCVKHPTNLSKFLAVVLYYLMEMLCFFLSFLPSGRIVPAKYILY